MPFLPRTRDGLIPQSRETYNEFIVWLDELGVPRDGKVILDVGANHGDFSLAALEWCPLARVFAFEVNPSVIPGLERKEHSLSGRLKIETVAAWSSEGKMEFQTLDNCDQTGSLTGFSDKYREVTESKGELKCFKVPLITLDAWAADQQISEVDILKVDVEGAERHVCQGGQALLNRCQAMICEISPLRNSAPDHLDEMLELIRSSGLKLLELRPSYFDRHQNPPSPVEFNALFFRPRRCAS